MTDWDDYPNFSKSEFDCSETGENEMQPGFLDKLQIVRARYGRPIIITSGYRSPNHSIEREKDEPGSHAQGCACDIAVGPGEPVWTLIHLAMLHGFTGIGVSQKGDPRFIHLDTMPRKAVWSY